MSEHVSILNALDIQQRVSPKKTSQERPGDTQKSATDYNCQIFMKRQQTEDRDAIYLDMSKSDSVKCFQKND